MSQTATPPAKVKVPPSIIKVSMSIGPGNGLSNIEMPAASPAPVFKISISVFPSKSMYFNGFSYAYRYEFNAKISLLFTLSSPANLPTPGTYSLACVKQVSATLSYLQLYIRMAASVPVYYKYLLQTHHSHIQLDFLHPAQEGELCFQDGLKPVFSIAYLPFILFYSYPVSKPVIAVYSLCLFIYNYINIRQISVIFHISTSVFTNKYYF